jgi:hypothetical protein
MIMPGLTADQLALFIAFSGMIVPAGCIYGLNLSYMIILGKHGFGSAESMAICGYQHLDKCYWRYHGIYFAAWIGVIYRFLMRIFTRRTIIILPF